MVRPEDFPGAVRACNHSAAMLVPEQSLRQAKFQHAVLPA